MMIIDFIHMKSNKSKVLRNRLTSAIKSCIIAIEVVTVRIVHCGLVLRKKITFTVRRTIAFSSSNFKFFLTKQRAKAQKENIMSKIMRNPRAFGALIATIATAFLLTACGGGGSSGATPGTPTVVGTEDFCSH